jgi:hypothetical protein
MANEEREKGQGEKEGKGGTGGGEGTKAQTGRAEKVVEEINPSSPGDTGTTPGTNAEIG